MKSDNDSTKCKLSSPTKIILQVNAPYDNHNINEGDMFVK